MTGTSTDQAEAISTASEAYVSAREYIESIDESDMLRPDTVGVWSGKDLIIHIADWERVGARIVEDLANGKEERWLPEGVDGNTYNEQRVREFSALSLSEAFEYWSNCNKEFLETYRSAGIDREDILFGLTRDHYRLHYPDFRHIKPFQELSDTDRVGLIETMDKSHDAFLTLVSSIPDKRLMKENTIGIWSGKDLIAHLGNWQEAATKLTRDLERGLPGKWPGEDGSNINEWNEARVAEKQDESLAEIRAYQQQAYDELRELMSTSAFATRSAGIGATEFHYGLHREDFESLKEDADASGTSYTVS